MVALGALCARQLEFRHGTNTNLRGCLNRESMPDGLPDGQPNPTLLIKHVYSATCTQISSTMALDDENGTIKLHVYFPDSSTFDSRFPGLTLFYLLPIFLILVAMVKLQRIVSYASYAIGLSSDFVILIQSMIEFATLRCIAQADVRCRRKLASWRP